MITGLPLLADRRIWYVPEINVWGTSGWAEIDLLLIENVDAVKAVMFESLVVGDSSQTVLFGNLVDFRGNSLPNTLKNPRVLVRSRGDDTAFVAGTETGASFKICRSSASTGPVMVDLLVMEMGD